MAIRIRRISGKIVALCAAKNKYKKGDIYLNDSIDHALRMKFLKDYEEEQNCGTIYSVLFDRKDKDY